ncbi:MAG: Ig domain-containing protein [Candidatus Korobacteraceae bacterium]
MVRTMRNLVTCCGVVVFAWAAASAAQGQSSAANQPAGLVIAAQTVASAVVGRSFNLPLAATGGAAPYSWRLVDGQLPPGLKLHAHPGAISGVPATAGEYRFTVAVADSSAPRLQVQRAMTISVIAGLTIDWKQYPNVQGATLSGSVVVTNQTGQDLDLTVIVVAVNSIGRATTLGYQHFILAGEQSGPVIPFSSSPGSGTYVVHADAIAHRPGGKQIYRARQQTSQPLPINQH